MNLCREDLFAAGGHFRNCHASSILPLAGGSVLVAYFAGEREGADDVGIWLSRRINGQWEAPRCVAKVAACAHWNPVLFAVKDGVRMVFKVGPHIPSWQSYTMRSTDGGASWSDPAPLSQSNPAGGPVRSKPIRLASGAILAPNSDESREAWLPCVDISNDEGQGFAKLADIPINRADQAHPGFIDGLGAIQPTLWESAPGQVHALLRTTGGGIFRSDSLDSGQSWCTAYPIGLPNNNSGIDIAAWDGSLYLAMNPVRGNWAARTPLILARSQDNGVHFSHFLTLEDRGSASVALDGEADPPAKAPEFSYPALVADNGILHVSYTHERTGIAYWRIAL